MSTFLKFYQRAFDKRPALTLVCANATLNAVGDVVAQTSQITVGHLNVKLFKVQKLSDYYFSLDSLVSKTRSRQHASSKTFIRPYTNVAICRLWSPNGSVFIFVIFYAFV